MSTLVTLPKTADATGCSQYRTLSLITYKLKVYQKIIHGILFKQLEEDTDNTHFGFRKGMGTREALFAYNVLVQRFADMNQYMISFNRIRQQILVALLRETNVDSRA